MVDKFIFLTLQWYKRNSHLVKPYYFTFWIGSFPRLETPNTVLTCCWATAVSFPLPSPISHVSPRGNALWLNLGVLEVGDTERIVVFLGNDQFAEISLWDKEHLCGVNSLTPNSGANRLDIDHATPKLISAHISLLQRLELVLLRCLGIVLLLLFWWCVFTIDFLLLFFWGKAVVLITGCPWTHHPPASAS